MTRRSRDGNALTDTIVDESISSVRDVIEVDIGTLELLLLMIPRRLSLL
jgi:hypothetical protein